MMTLAPGMWLMWSLMPFVCVMKGWLDSASSLHLTAHPHPRILMIVSAGICSLRHLAIAQIWSATLRRMTLVKGEMKSGSFTAYQNIGRRWIKWQRWRNRSRGFRQARYDCDSLVPPGQTTPQLLADGEVVMGFTYNGRLFSVIEEQKHCGDAVGCAVCWMAGSFPPV